MAAVDDPRGAEGAAVASQSRSETRTLCTARKMGRRFFIDTCAFFERAEAGLTAPLLSHHGQQCTGHAVAAVDDPGGSERAAVALLSRSATRTLCTDGEVGRRFFLYTCACFERAEAAVTAPLLSHHG